jgi:carbon starvation protein
MALIAASVLEPGAYFAMNSAPAVIGSTVEQAAQTIAGWGFVITPEALTQMARDVGESTILSRTGGAPTLAVGMAHILSNVIGGANLMAFWYHFAILFEALFILTTVDAGTRVARFMIQDLLGTVAPAMRRTQSWSANLIATALAVSAWGYFLYRGVIDPLGGVNTLWPLFGISNQMLAAIALTLCTVVLFKMKRQRYAWVSALPTLWLVACTLVAGWQKLFHANPAIGFLAHAAKFAAAANRDEVLAPAKSVAEMHSVILNDYVGAALCCAFMVVVVAMLVYGIVGIRKALSNPASSTNEVPDDLSNLDRIGV